MAKRIALAADGSENALRAAREAVKLANLSPGATIEVIYVADHTKAKSEILHAGDRETLEYNRRQRIRPVEDLLRGENIPHEVRFLHGDPAPAIIDYVNSQPFDLIILGSRGLNALQEMVLGSVSHKVVKRADAPVLIVK
ncbi:universal stress protein [Bhargavaea cecembensis]|uniref:universal stress protein n=1 Tax=Bhargavaea cecembensis TaxID=394098 RepID=UPI0005906B17|nr:universal stress protein [Bhargavaea cecembensis]